MEGWIRLLELRDVETRDHARRVAVLTVDLARRSGFPESALAHVRRGALLHDIGKITVPDAILHKPGPLDAGEREVVRRHPAWAREFLLSFEALRAAIDIPWCHHERWDGSGYPRGLAGSSIPRAARVFAVVDVYDALRSTRPYRAAWGEERVRRFIAERSGTHFDPEVVGTFLSAPSEVDVPPALLSATA